MLYTTARAIKGGNGLISTYHTTVPAREMKQMARMAVPSSHLMAATMMAMVSRKESTERM